MVDESVYGPVHISTLTVYSVSMVILEIENIPPVLSMAIRLLDRVYVIIFSGFQPFILSLRECGDSLM